MEVSFIILGGIVQVVISSNIVMAMHVDHAENLIAVYPAMVTAAIASACIVKILIVLCISACYATIEFRLMTQI